MGMVKRYMKGDVLQEAGQKRLNIYSVQKGLLRLYFSDTNGKDHNFMFASEGWTCGDVEAYAFDIEGTLTIEAIEDCEVEVFPPLALFQNNEQVEFRKMLRRAGALQRRVLMMMSTSALERYEHFLELYPELTSRLTQRHIASYLGITPQALSKLRAQRVGKAYAS